MEAQAHGDEDAGRVGRHRTRERIWISENAHVVRGADGRVLHYEGTVEEITDRVRDQQALERWAAQFSLIARQLPGVVYRVRIAPDGTPQFDFISAGVRELRKRNVGQSDNALSGASLNAVEWPGSAAPAVLTELVDADEDADIHVHTWSFRRR